MAKKIICPTCGNCGEAAIDDSGAFEVRGQFQGRAVRKCNKCGSGLFLGIFSGGLFGKAKPIPPELWQSMEKIWQKEFTQDSRRESIPVSQLGNDLAEMTLDSTSLNEISEKLFQQQGISIKIDDSMREEWLIFLMFSATKGIQSADIQQNIMTSILDYYHYSIYQAVFSNDEERDNFEQQVNKRYVSYQNILNKNDEKALEQLGMSVSENILKKPDIVLPLLVAKFFIINANSSREFVEDISKKFELVL